MGPLGEGLESGDQGSARRRVKNRWASVLLTQILEQVPTSPERLNGTGRGIGQMSMEVYLVIFVLVVGNFALLEAKTPLVIGKLHKEKNLLMVALFWNENDVRFSSRRSIIYLQKPIWSRILCIILA